MGLGHALRVLVLRALMANTGTHTQVRAKEPPVPTAAPC